jgi:NADP-dependent 3-hydroxy acid dehydrogenase YdfG
MRSTGSGASRVVAITGGARGIGRATATALRERGMSVAIGDIDAAALAEAATSLGSGALATELDVTDRASFARFVEDVERELGPLDVLVNNAGIMPIGPLVNEREQTARRVFEINALGCLNGMAVVLPGMLARARGHVINVASVAGRAPVPGGASYAASKAAIVSLTESARVEHRRTGVKFTCVMPSFTATELILGTKGTKFLKTVQPEDVARAIAKVINHPRADVYVPAIVGPLLRVQPLMGRRLRDASQRTIGAYDTFLNVDQEERASYDVRIGNTSPDPDIAPL